MRKGWRAGRWAALGLGIAAAAASAAPAEGGCDATLRWNEDASLVTTHVREPAVDLSMRRYQDAVRIGFTGPDGAAKSILSLEHGPELIFGSDKPAEFLDAGMPAMIAVFFLMKHYASPCTVPPDDVFDFQVDHDSAYPGPVRVTGKARRTGNRIDYEIHVAAVTPPPGRLPGLIDATGSWSHEPPAPVGEDFDVRGSKVVVGMNIVEGAAPATVAEARTWYARAARP